MKIFKVAEREFIEAVKTKAFIIGFVITAVVFIGMIFFINKTSRMKSAPQKDINLLIVDLTGKLEKEIEKSFNEYNNQTGVTRINVTIPKDIPIELNKFLDEQKALVANGSYGVFVQIDSGVINGEGSSKYYTIAKNLDAIEYYQVITSLISESVREMRIKENNLDSDVVKKLLKPVFLEQINLGANTETKGFSVGLMLMPFFFMYLMFIGIVGVSQQMLTTVVEEKSSRVYEVLLASLTPFELMAGKIIGLSFVGFVTIGIWGTAGMIYAFYSGFTNLISIKLGVLFVFYFILGFLVIASMIAAIGATCNTLREAQNYMTPIMMLLMLPIISWFYIARNPDSIFAVVLSFFPPTAPLAMILRLAVNPELSWISIIISLIILIISVPIVIKISAKVFRIGILMYGKTPSPKEILKWLRYN